MLVRMPRGRGAGPEYRWRHRFEDSVSTQHVKGCLQFPGLWRHLWPVFNPVFLQRGRGSEGETVRVRQRGQRWPLERNGGLGMGPRAKGGRRDWLGIERPGWGPFLISATCDEAFLALNGGTCTVRWWQEGPQLGREENEGKFS